MHNMTKRLALITICFLFSAITSWAQEIICEGENNGVLMLSVSELNVKKSDAVDKAIKDAYFQILFRGIPGSKEYKQPLLGTDENVMKNNAEYFDDMLNGGRIYSFINYSALSYYKRKEAVVKVSLNVQALQADLEKHNIYRRFGLY